MISTAVNSHPSDTEEKETVCFVPTSIFPVEQRGVAQSKSMSLSFPAATDRSPSYHLDDKTSIKLVIRERKRQ